MKENFAMYYLKLMNNLYKKNIHYKSVDVLKKFSFRSFFIASVISMASCNDLNKPANKDKCEITGPIDDNESKIEDLNEPHSSKESNEEDKNADPTSGEREIKKSKISPKALDNLHNCLEKLINNSKRRQSTETFNLLKRLLERKAKNAKKEVEIKKPDLKGDGWEYFGSVVSERASGIGKMVFDNGDYMEGKFLDSNLIEGRIKHTYINGDVYEGMWKDRGFEGKGKYIYDDGRYEEGEFVNGGPSLCSLFDKDDQKIGEIKNLGDGIFQITYEGTKDMYTGQLEKGKKQGHGKLTWHQTGSYFEGDFDHGLIKCGQLSDNERYKIGDVERDEDAIKNGENIPKKGKEILKVKYVDGSTYKGQLRDGKRHGVGIYVKDKEKEEYSGFWKNDTYIRICEKIANKAEENLSHVFKKINILLKKEKPNLENDEENWKYYGEFVDSQPHGKGRKVYAVGDYEEGTFVEGVFVEGTAKITDENGNIAEGEWKNGSLNGKGKYIWTNGDYYEGNFINDCFEGNNTIVCNNGIVLIANFKEDQYTDASLLWGEKKIGTIETIETIGDKFIRRLTYENGNIYEGELKSGKPLGEGKIFYKGSDKYTGMWENGKIKNLKFLESTVNKISHDTVLSNNDIVSNAVKKSEEFVKNLLESRLRKAISSFLQNYKINVAKTTHKSVDKDNYSYIGEFKGKERDGKGVLIIKSNELKFKGTFAGDYPKQGTVFEKTELKTKVNKLVSNKRNNRNNVSENKHIRAYREIANISTINNNIKIEYLNGDIYEGTKFICKEIYEQNFLKASYRSRFVSLYSEGKMFYKSGGIPINAKRNNEGLYYLTGYLDDLYFIERE